MLIVKQSFVVDSFCQVPSGLKQPQDLGKRFSKKSVAILISVLKRTPLVGSLKARAILWARNIVVAESHLGPKETDLSIHPCVTTWNQLGKPTSYTIVLTKS